MRRLVALGLLAALAAGCGGRSAAEPAGGAGKPEAITVTVANVAVRSVERTVSVVGTLAANAQAEVASEVEGQVAAILADLGDRVAEGHVLARVRRDEIEARLREAEASLAKATGDDKKSLEDIAKSPYVFPSAQDLANTRRYRDLTVEEEKTWNRIFEPIFQS